MSGGSSGKRPAPAAICPRVLANSGIARGSRPRWPLCWSEYVDRFLPQLQK
jgi:hypothetical protein